MKAKAFHNKLLAIVLTVVLVALSVPTAIFMVGASGEVPTVDATTDIGKYVNFYQDKNLFKEYDETGSLKLSSSNILTTYGDNYTAGGTYYASVKMTFDPDFEFKYSVNSETGKWEKKGVSYGQNGFVIGTMTDGTTTKNVTVAYRHGQGVFYLFNDDTSFSKGLGGGATAGLNEVTVTVKYDAATGLLSTWFNGTQGNDVDTTTLKDGWTFTFGGFDLRTMGGGSRPADKEDGTNEETVTNSMTFSDLHIWGDVTTTKHYMAPSIGSATNIANTLTLSDSALNTDWKDDGAFTWNFTNATFNGIDFAENTIVYASVTMSGIKKGNGGSDIFGVAFAKDGDSYAYNYLRPQWNQQGVSGSGNISLTSTDGWGVAGSDGSLASWDTQDQVFIYKYDVNEKTVEVWRRTAVYQSYWGSVWAASYQDIYVGKFSINSPAAMVLGIYTSPSADVATFQGQPTVKDVKVWVEESSAPTPPPSDEEPEEGAFTLSDAVLNAQYAESGEIVIDSTTGTVFINGINVVPGIGQKIIYSFDKQYSRAPYDDLVTYGKINPVMVYAAKTDGTIAGYGPNPGWNQTSHVGGLTLAGSVLGSTGSYNKGTSAKETYKVVYDVDTGKVELWANTERIAGYHANGELLMATATLDNGFAFKPGISGNEITGGTATISNIKVEYSSTSSIDTTNKVGNFVAYEGGFLDTGIKYDNSTDLGVSNTPKWEEGTTVNNTGIFTSLKQGGYDGKKTIVWKGNRTGDLTKGAIIYQADFTIYNKTTGWNGTNWGFVVAKVDGHYVSTGFGIHGAAGAAYKNTTVIDGSNIGEQASANTAFLGASCNGSYSVAGTEDGVTVTLTAVLTSTSLTTYINGVKGQTFDFTGKTVEPMFAFAWGSGNANDKITNVKFMGDGIVEIPCEHSYSYDCDTKCDLCGEEREIEDYLHQYKSACALKCMYCGVERLHAPDDHSYSNACDPTCNNCDETRTVDPSLHNYTSDCDAFCDNCNYERTLDASVQHTYSDNCDITCNLCGAERTPPHTYSSDCDAECDGCGASRTPLGNHTFDGPQDAFCNGCGAERIAINTLKKNGELTNVFKDQLAASTPLIGVSLDMNPAQFATQSISLGGAIFDISKGYTISADFTVKTNASMESHFGITAVVINNDIYTFGMLSNGNWSTNTPTQQYVPYARKNNGNTLVSASGSNVTATDEGATVNLKVVVTASSATYYINNVEALTIDLTGKTILPYAAFTSRGANVTVSNIEFFGAGVKNHATHDFDSACDAVCDTCYAVRVAADHQYDDETCDVDCNVCGSKREVTHKYSFVCDDVCDVCGTKRDVTHTFTDNCDETCDVDGCTATRKAPHSYENDCDKDCDLCGATRFVSKHVYDDNNDLECNVCGYKRPAYDFSGMADHTDEMYLNNKEYRDNFAGNGKFTMTDGITTSDNALIAKNNGKVVVSANIKFNGNVDFNWLDTNNDGEYKYENAWGKTGIKIGTYFEVDDNLTRSVYVSFRRCSAHAYLFNEGNKILGDFGAAGAMTAKNIKLTVLYDIKSGEVHLWADDIYVGVASVANLKDFKFNIGFVTQGLGTSAVDKDDVTNGETKPNSVTISDIKVLGDVKVDPNFELPAVEHTHEYDNDKDLICNTCGAEKIKFAPLKNTTGKLEVLFEDQLKNATAVTSNSYSLNPGAYSTHSILLGGAKYDFTKGGYTISADFYVKTNSSMESHFGITALVINNEPYTFGMLANGDWSTTPVSPIQVYTPYIRKNNGNELLSAGGNKVTATEKGAKVSLFVDVNDARAIFYINGTEARMIDLTGKTVAPYAALTSRGANVTVKNVQFNGKGVTNCTEHKYSGACDAICDICYGGFRKAKAHTYD
ncbi:MAG: hypothetical protein IKV36_05135, partial [Clostridia bacterium]|nr:hypothetical protein [Clostridia bacterium]